MQPQEALGQRIGNFLGWIDTEEATQDMSLPVAERVRGIFIATMEGVTPSSIQGACDTFTALVLDDDYLSSSGVTPDIMDAMARIILDPMKEEAAIREHKQSNIVGSEEHLAELTRRFPDEMKEHIRDREEVLADTAATPQDRAFAEKRWHDAIVILTQIALGPKKRKADRADDA